MIELSWSRSLVRYKVMLNKVNEEKSWGDNKLINKRSVFGVFLKVIMFVKVPHITGINYQNMLRI